MNQFEMRQKAYQSSLNSRALQVLLYLIDRADREQTCFPAVATIGRELHISISTVKRAMKDLVAHGYVKKESRFREGNRGQTSNLYTLFFPEGQERETGKEKERQVKSGSILTDSIVVKERKDCVERMAHREEAAGGKCVADKEKSNIENPGKENCERSIERRGYGAPSFFGRKWLRGKCAYFKGLMKLCTIGDLKRMWTGEGVRMIPP